MDTTTTEPRELTRFTVMLRDAEIQKIRYMAVDRRTSASEILRTAISEFLSRHGSNGGHSKQ